MPRVRVVKPKCPRCGSSRFVGCYLGQWMCHGPHNACDYNGPYHDYECPRCSEDNA